MSQGRRIKLSNGRRLVDDVIRIAQRTPLASLTRDLDLSILSTLRRHTRPKVTWNVLMMKAYGIVSMQNAELRRSYVSFPWPHFYEHDETVCMITMARNHSGEERLLFARFNNPEQQSLSQLQSQFDHFRYSPVDDILQFQHQISFASMPTLIRRLAWWSLINFWPQKRCSHMGTFGMSLSRYKDAVGGQLLGPTTTAIGVDPIPRKAISRILFTFDHRVIDGKPAAETVDALRFHLTHTITREVKDMLIADGLDPEEILCRSKYVGKTRNVA